MGNIILNGTVYAGGSGGSGGGETILLNTIYSDTEKKVGYWRDNKPLYQKTIYTNNATVNNSVAISVSSLNVDSLVDIEGTYDRIVNWMSPPLHMVYCFDVYEDNDEQSFIRYDVDDKNIVYRIKVANNEATSYQAITIQYTKTTDNPETPDIGNVIYLPTIYSDEERQVGVWRDNKPLYQKTAYIPSVSIPSNSATTINISDYFSNVENAIKYECCDTTRGDIYPNIMANSNLSPYNIGVTIEQSSDHIIFTRGNGGSATLDFRLTLWYTKTTDTAGSGNWNADGTPTHHYSTNEQVVGTWLDGSTLYEKSFELTNLTQDTNNHVIDATLTKSAISMKQIIKGFYTLGGAYSGDGFGGDDLYADNVSNRIRVFCNANGLCYSVQNSSYQITRFTLTVRYTKN